ncbi:MAG: glycosyltransferase family 9 protein [Candidatus Cloacimonadota bacterium]|nr:MAG: glycosyltransferase family 9 protein [Candidatus Cloacimonadota bacterium]
MKILIVRTDRIGDVVLSLPLAEILKEKIPDCEINFMPRESIKELIYNQPYIDRVITYNSQGLSKSIRILKKERYDIAFLLFPSFSLSLMLFLARIPQRIGTGFRWYSFLLNQRIYEHRLPSEKHEVEYNLGLLRKLDISESVKKPKLYVDIDEKLSATQFLKNIGIDSDSFIVVHSGSGGSSLSWPEQNYKKLVTLLSKELGYQIVLSGTEEEFVKTERLREGCDWKVVNIAGKTNLRELAAVISLAQIFISSSTGPMHIASAVDTKVIAFFPPSRVNRKTRWGPLNTSLVFEPPVPYCERCIKEKCKYYNCLSLITPESVMEGIKNWKTKRRHEDTKAQRIQKNKYS